jgi:hypothetical protein
MRPKIYHGSTIGLRLPRDIDLLIRAKSLESGRSLSELVRESLIATWRKGQKGQETRTGQ